MKITREQLKAIVGEVLQEEKDYQSFFQAMLKKHGVSSPDEFKTDDEKKAFFNKIDSTWKGVSERIKSWKEAKWNEAELTAKQQKIDLNKNGKVDGDDLAKLRAGQTAEGEEEQLPSTQILSKEGETLVKSGKGNMYNIKKVTEAITKKDIQKLGTYKDFDKFFKANKNKLNKKDLSYIEDEIGALKYLESDEKRGHADREEVLVAVEEIQDLLIKSLAVKEREVKDIAIGLLN